MMVSGRGFGGRYIDNTASQTTCRIKDLQEENFIGCGGTELEGLI